MTNKITKTYSVKEIDALSSSQSPAFSSNVAYGFSMRGLPEGFSEKSDEEKKSILETASKKLKIVANKLADIAREGANKTNKGLQEIDTKPVEGVKKLFAGVVDCKLFIEKADGTRNFSKEVFQEFITVLNNVIKSSKEFLEHSGLMSKFCSGSIMIGDAITEEDVKKFSKGIDLISEPHNTVVYRAIHEFVNHKKGLFEEIVEDLNRSSDELISLVNKSGDIKEGDLGWILEMTGYFEEIMSDALKERMDDEHDQYFKILESAFHSSNAPVAYGFFDDIGNFFEKDVGRFFEKAGNTFVDGFEKFAEGVKKGDWDKVSEGAIRILTPIGKVTKEEINKHFDEKSHEEKKSLLENFAKKFIDVANKSAEIASEGARKFYEGASGLKGGEKILEGMVKVENTQGEVIVRDVIRSSKGEIYQKLTEITDARTSNYAMSVNDYFKEGDLKSAFKLIESINEFSQMTIIYKIKPVLLKISEKLNTFSDELTNIADKLSEDIKEENLDKMLKEIEELKQIDPELAEHSSTFESTDTSDNIELYSEFIFF